MSLTDCWKCWDSPCSCGEAGYLVVRPTDREDVKKLRQLDPDTMKALVAGLRAGMDVFLGALPAPCADHWHCDPVSTLLVAHDCGKVDRYKPCPTCGRAR